MIILIVNLKNVYLNVFGFLKLQFSRTILDYFDGSKYLLILHFEASFKFCFHPRTNIKSNFHLQRHLKQLTGNKTLLSCPSYLSFFIVFSIQVVIISLFCLKGNKTYYFIIIIIEKLVLVFCYCSKYYKVITYIVLILLFLLEMFLFVYRIRSFIT